MKEVKKRLKIKVHYKTWRFSQLLLLLSFKHILLSISRARLRLIAVLLSLSFETTPFPLVVWRRNLRSRDSRSLICLSTPTSSSSTLCWIPLEVSMNLHSREVANCLPSERNSSSVYFFGVLFLQIYLSQIATNRRAFRNHFGILEVLREKVHLTDFQTNFWHFSRDMKI